MDNGESSYRRFLDGDESAFGEILDMYSENLIFFINRYVNNVAVAQELSEDVFVEILLHKRRYNFKTSLKTYLFTIGRNKAVSYLRRCVRRPECAYEYIENESDRRNIEDEFIKKERERELHRAINTLNDDYKTVLHLIYFENMNYEQTAAVMKKNRKQIENLAYRARQALKKELEREAKLP
ncbi:MAG: sigma-70 family RNA polymerase sigma factor [Acutalibacteraceae bacterium]|nr:sigma-70 family RNA polymerase sigma factor [Acutalibacteraceae bacterium]